MLLCRCYQLASSLAYDGFIYLAQLPISITTYIIYNQNFKQSFIFAESVLIIDALTWSTIGSTCYQRNVTELTLREEQPARCRSSRRPKVRSINKRLQSDG